jgi:hypothetical protein
MNKDWKAVHKLVKNIFKELQEKDENGELTDNAKKAQTPCACVVTFESEEGVTRALTYNDEIDIYNNPQPNENMSKYNSFLGKKDGLKIDIITEPTDIIVEN